VGVFWVGEERYVQRSGEEKDARTARKRVRLGKKGKYSGSPDAGSESVEERAYVKKTRRSLKAGMVWGEGGSINFCRAPPAREKKEPLPRQERGKKEPLLTASRFLKKEEIIPSTGGGIASSIEGQKKEGVVWEYGKGKKEENLAPDEKKKERAAEIPI